MFQIWEAQQASAHGVIMQLQDADQDLMPAAAREVSCLWNYMTGWSLAFSSPAVRSCNMQSGTKRSDSRPEVTSKVIAKLFQGHFN